MASWHVPPPTDIDAPPSYKATTSHDTGGSGAQSAPAVEETKQGRSERRRPLALARLDVGGEDEPIAVSEWSSGGTSSDDDPSFGASTPPLQYFVSDSYAAADPNTAALRAAATPPMPMASPGLPHVTPRTQVGQMATDAAHEEWQWELQFASQQGYDVYYYNATSGASVDTSSATIDVLPPRPARLPTFVACCLSGLPPVPGCCMPCAAARGPALFPADLLAACGADRSWRWWFPFRTRALLLGTADRLARQLPQHVPQGPRCVLRAGWRRVAGGASLEVEARVPGPQVRAVQAVLLAAAAVLRRCAR